MKAGFWLLIIFWAAPGLVVHAGSKAASLPGGQKADLEKWAIHDETRPLPPVVDPGPVGTSAAAPSDAVILFDRNSFFQNILEILKARLSELGAVKKKIGDKWYWDLNPNYKFGDEIIIE